MCHLRADTFNSFWFFCLVEALKRKLRTAACTLADASRRTWPPSCRTIPIALDKTACESLTELLVKRQGRVGRTASSDRPIQTVPSPLDTHPLFRKRDVNIGSCVSCSLLPLVCRRSPSALECDEARSTTDAYRHLQLITAPPQMVIVHVRWRPSLANHLIIQQSP